MVLFLFGKFLEAGDEMRLLMRLEGGGVGGALTLLYCWLKKHPLYTGPVADHLFARFLIMSVIGINITLVCSSNISITTVK